MTNLSGGILPRMTSALTAAAIQIGFPMSASQKTYRGLSLDRFQRDAIDSLDNGRSVLVAAPTGTGKTLIADWIVEEALRTGKSVVYTAPIKALSNQKYRDYVQLHGAEKVGLVTGDLVINRNAPCLVMTTEILRNILLLGEELPELLAVIIDEIHFLDDRDRGTVWEELLIYLPHSVLIVGLSATLSNLKEFADWLSEVRQQQVKVITEHKRSVPLTIHYASRDTGILSPKEYDKRWKKHQQHQQGRSAEGHSNRRGRERQNRNRGFPRRPSRRTGHLHLFELVRDKALFPYLYFVFSRRDTETCARGLYMSLSEPLLNAEEQAKLEAIVSAAAPRLGAALDPELRAMYRHGIAFHHAGLHVLLKLLVEELYENRLIRALYCTSTFALGINMPTRTVVFDGIRKFNGQQMALLTTRQFMQKAGRAGRRGLDESGEVIVRVDYEEYEELKPVLNRYAQGSYEPVRSAFNLSWNSVINLVASHDLDHVRTILEKSFLNWSLTRQAERHFDRADELDQLPRITNRQRKEARRLRRRASRNQSRVWEEFVEKLNFLTAIGYLSEETELLSGAKILRSVQISEIFLTELVLDGVLETLEPALLFGVLCAMTMELPRKSNRLFGLDREQKGVARHFQRIRFSRIVVDGEELSGDSISWDRFMIPIGIAWYRGLSLNDVVTMVETPTDISGDIINAFRRAKDIAGQLCTVYADLPESVEKYRAMMKVISRDEVVAV
jgi:superfamily II RNA helicase